MDLKSAIDLAYLAAAVLFVVGIKRLSKVKTARSGNTMAAVAMLIAVVAALGGAWHLFSAESIPWLVGGAVAGIVVGALAARLVEMTAMPEMVALFNGSGGAASFLVALAALWGWSAQPPGEQVMTQAILQPDLLHLAKGAANPYALREIQEAVGAGSALALVLSLLVGGVTLSGSLVAYGKLSGRMTGNAIVFPGQHVVNMGFLAACLGVCGYAAFAAEGTGLIEGLAIGIVVASLVLGVLLVIPIGGADMPVVISLLNSYSGIAAAMTGFVLQNTLLIVSGAMVGASGLILTAIMCKAMNRSLISVLMGGYGMTTAGGGDKSEYKNVKSLSAEELAMMLDGVSSVIFVPGYGLAVSQAQHVTRELADLLQARGAEVRYAIHPVAGRMPGHMNVLLAESNVPYEQLVEMDDINPDFKTTDVVIVLGANDVVNPAALDEKDSPLFGMPILLTHEAQNVIVVKRSLSPGYAGVKNKLFEMDNCYMVFADAKAALQETLNELKAAAAA